MLEDFILWAAKKYPAEHYMVVVWNHGAGWDDENVYRLGRDLGRNFTRRGSNISDTRFGSSTPLSTARAISTGRLRRAVFNTSISEALTTRAIAFDDNARDFLDNIEMKNVFSSVTKRLGRKIDIIGLDACLMNMLEVHYQLKDQALFCVGSQEVEPGDGWPYDTVLSTLSARPAMTPQEVSGMIVTKYLQSYKPSDNVTQSACGMAGAQPVADALDGLSLLLASRLSSAEVRMAVIEARSRVQSYYVADYVDLVDFCLLLMRYSDMKEIRQACQGVIDPLVKKGMVLKSGYKGREVNDSHGVSIYFPTKKISPLYSRLDFVKKTKWGAFLRAFLGKLRER